MIPFALKNKGFGGLSVKIERLEEKKKNEKPLLKRAPKLMPKIAPKAAIRDSEFQPRHFERAG